jgi:hypothetical protein
MIKILFLGANPAGTTQLALTREVQAITQHIRSAGKGEQLQVEQEWAVKISDLQAALLRHKPDIVHFSGHGSAAGELIFETEAATAAPAQPEALATLFKILKENIRGVVLNACFSEAQAKAIAKHIDFVVGMRIAVDDQAAIAFAWGFYQAVAFNSSVQQAFALACNQIALSGLPGENTPKLIWRPALKAIKPAKPYHLVDEAPAAREGASPATPRADDATDPHDVARGAGHHKEEARYHARVAKIDADVTRALEAQPRVAAALAQQLGVTAAPGEVARVVAREIVSVRKADDIVAAVDEVDSKLEKEGAELADRVAIRTIFWQILPLVIDWRKLVVTGRATLAGGAGAIDLPVRTATIAEIVLAGISERCCNFAPPRATGLPVGATLVRLPAEAESAIFDLDGSRLAQSIVKQLAAEVNIGAEYASYDDMRAAVEGRLIYRAKRAPEGERLPYYLLFPRANLEGKDSAHDLWTLARTALGKALPSLHLVRLTGDDLTQEMVLASSIEAILNRTP